MTKIPPLVEGPRKGGRNPVRENFVRPNPPLAIRAKQTTTQTQIEAAAKALYGDHGRPPSDRAMAMAKTALTAAAEVGERDGELDDITIRFQLERIKTLETELAATIERCAQVAENHPAYAGKMIAAAIRALKDKP